MLNYPIIFPLSLQKDPITYCNVIPTIHVYLKLIFIGRAFRGWTMPFIYVIFFTSPQISRVRIIRPTIYFSKYDKP